MRSTAGGRCELYGGADLGNAARLSGITSSGERFRGLGNATRLVLGSLTKLLRKPPPSQLCAVLAKVRGDAETEPLKVLYVGRGSNRAWLLSGLFELLDEQVIMLAETGTEIDAALEQFRSDANIVIVEDASPAMLSKLRLEFLHMPAWIKQRVSIRADWSDQVRGMRRSTRREIARLLRKYQYSCNVSRSREDFERFYDKLYVPYIVARHGDSAELVARPNFLSECEKGTVLELREGDDVIGASLVRPTGATMSVVWTGLRAAANGPPPKGAAEVLDYFCLLYGHLQGFRWLDLGPSRPDLRDGTCRYKARWNSVVHRGFFKPREIHWAFARPSDSVGVFLSQHAFIWNVAQGLMTTFVINEASPDRSQLQALVKRYMQPGIDACRIIILGRRQRHDTDVDMPPGNGATLAWLDDSSQLAGACGGARPAGQD